MNKAPFGALFILGTAHHRVREERAKRLCQPADRPVRRRAQSADSCAQGELAHVRTGFTGHPDAGIADSPQAGWHHEISGRIAVRERQEWTRRSLSSLEKGFFRPRSPRATFAVGNMRASCGLWYHPMHHGRW